MYRKKTHIEEYLHGSSHHFPTQKVGVLSTLATCALEIYDEDQPSKEKSHLLNVFVHNGYSMQEGVKAFLKASKGPKVKKDPIDCSSGFLSPSSKGR